MNRWEKFFDECIKEIAKEVIILDMEDGTLFKGDRAHTPQ